MIYRYRTIQVNDNIHFFLFNTENGDVEMGDNCSIGSSSHRSYNFIDRVQLAPGTSYKVEIVQT